MAYSILSNLIWLIEQTRGEVSNKVGLTLKEKRRKEPYEPGHC